MRKLLTLTVIFGISALSRLLIAQEEVLTVAEQMPYFPGCADLPNGSPQKRDCSDENLVGFIADYLEYPAEALKNGIEGTVYISFVIDENGKVQDPVVVRDIGGGCGGEALRIVSNMPVWEPAMNRRKPARVRLNLPVRFQLQAAAQDPAEEFVIHWGGLKNGKVTRGDLLSNLDQELVVRNSQGNSVDISELLFAYKHGKSIKEAESRGEVTKEMHTLVHKVRKGGRFIVVATVQKEGQFVDVEREFEIVKK